MHVGVRIVAIVLLLVAAFGLCVWYAEADLWDVPHPEDPGFQDDERTMLFLDVHSIDPDDGSLIGEHNGHTIEVRNVDQSVLETIGPESSIQVDGTIADDSSAIVADRIVVDIHDSTDWLYVIGSSIVGLLLALGGFFRHWRIHFRRLQFEPRSASHEPPSGQKTPRGGKNG